MRYFLEVSYKGTNYAGFQIQKNAPTIQSKVEEALQIIYKTHIALTGSSRTDAGVHANQNYFHFDVDFPIDQKVLYNLNALLPADISVKGIRLVTGASHSRFDALSRKYSYHIHTAKDPFLTDTSWFYPYQLNNQLLEQAASLITQFTNFEAFSKKNTQVYTHNCSIIYSKWSFTPNHFIYHVQANRFLRGMVRALVGTMLQVGRGKISIEEFQSILAGTDNTKADFSTPAKGLFLMEVNFPDTCYCSSL
ncbi:MAG: tRNA pseudouridine synthase [Segetibacter sp.]|nr:tRNA pseudouridine synthase [Segetibacter sp.]